MKKLFAVALMFVSASCFGQLTAVPRPDVKIGDTWTYTGGEVRTGSSQSTTFTVTEVTSDKVVVESSTGTIQTSTRDMNVVEERRGETVTSAAKPYWPRYEFPLDVGKKWERSFEYMTRGGASTYRAQWSATVAGSEKTKVPAGTFDTLKIEIRGYYQGTNASGTWRGSWNETLWYAPVVKRAVKRELQDISGAYNNMSRFELVSFKVAD